MGLLNIKYMYDKILNINLEMKSIEKAFEDSEERTRVFRNQNTEHEMQIQDGDIVINEIFMGKPARMFRLPVAGCNYAAEREVERWNEEKHGIYEMDEMIHRYATDKENIKRWEELPE